MNGALLSDTMPPAIQMKQTLQLERSLSLAGKLAPSLGHCQVLPGHLLLVLLEDSDIAFLLNAYGVDIKQAKGSILKLFPRIQPRQAPNNQAMPVSGGLTVILDHARASAQANGLGELDSTFVFATLLREDSPFSRVLEADDLSYESVTQFMELQTGSTVTIGEVPPYTIPDAAYIAPAPTAAPAMPAAATAAQVPSAEPGVACFPGSCFRGSVARAQSGTRK